MHGHSANTDFRLVLSSSFLSTPPGGGRAQAKQKGVLFPFSLDNSFITRSPKNYYEKRRRRGGSLTLYCPPTHISGDRNCSFSLSVKLCFGKTRGEIESTLTAMQAGLSSLRLLLIGYAMLAAPVFRVGFFRGFFFALERTLL